jgi:hypothetical protein
MLPDGSSTRIAPGATITDVTAKVYVGPAQVRDQRVKVLGDDMNLFHPPGFGSPPA